MGHTGCQTACKTQDLSAPSAASVRERSTASIVEIPLRRLDEVLAECDIAAIDYLSIDTEGSELSILRTLNLPALGVRALTVENNRNAPEGVVRTLKMPPDGRVIRELLAAQEKYAYTYKFIGQHRFANDYQCTIRVVPIDAGKSRIELKSEFVPRPELNAEEVVGNMQKSVSGNLKAMKRALGLPKDA